MKYAPGCWFPGKFHQRIHGFPFLTGTLSGNPHSKEVLQINKEMKSLLSPRCSTWGIHSPVHLYKQAPGGEMLAEAENWGIELFQAGLTIDVLRRGAHADCPTSGDELVQQVQGALPDADRLAPRPSIRLCRPSTALPASFDCGDAAQHLVTVIENEILASAGCANRSSPGRTASGGGAVQHPH